MYVGTTWDLNIIFNYAFMQLAKLFDKFNIFSITNPKYLNAGFKMYKCDTGVHTPGSPGRHDECPHHLERHSHQEGLCGPVPGQVLGVYESE